MIQLLAGGAARRQASANAKGSRGGRLHPWFGSCKEIMRPRIVPCRQAWAWLPTPPRSRTVHYKRHGPILRRSAAKIEKAWAGAVDAEAYRRPAAHAFPRPRDRLSNHSGCPVERMSDLTYILAQWHRPLNLDPCALCSPVVEGTGKPGGAGPSTRRIDGPLRAVFPPISLIFRYKPKK